MSEVNASFSFGKNWEAFVEHYFTDERVDISKQHILDFLELDSLEGRYFIDVGCGSGLSSLSAYRAGASKILSFDVDPYSVKTTQRLREREGNPDHWTVLDGSVLDKEFLATLEPSDLVYSWGVLHHTGSMWEAIENAMTLVSPDGDFYIALYTTTAKSDYWIGIKKEYNQAGKLKKYWMETRHVLGFIKRRLRSGTNPFSHIMNYKNNRGMEYITDVRDWLGGWPYEDATIEEVQAFFQERGWEQTKIKTGEANTNTFAKIEPS